MCGLFGGGGLHVWVGWWWRTACVGWLVVEDCMCGLVGGGGDGKLHMLVDWW